MGYFENLLEEKLIKLKLVLFPKEKISFNFIILEKKIGLLLKV